MGCDGTGWDALEIRCYVICYSVNIHPDGALRRLFLVYDALVLYIYVFSLLCSWDGQLEQLETKLSATSPPYEAAEARAAPRQEGVSFLFPLSSSPSSSSSFSWLVSCVFVLFC